MRSSFHWPVEQEPRTACTISSVGHNTHLQFRLAFGLVGTLIPISHLSSLVSERVPLPPEYEPGFPPECVFPRESTHPDSRYHLRYMQCHEKCIKHILNITSYDTIIFAITSIFAHTQIKLNPYMHVQTNMCLTNNVLTKQCFQIVA